MNSPDISRFSHFLAYGGSPAKCEAQGHVVNVKGHITYAIETLSLDLDPDCSISGDRDRISCLGVGILFSSCRYPAKCEA